MYEIGNILKSKSRSREHPLFVMVFSYSNGRFTGQVIFDPWYYTIGKVYKNWSKEEGWELSNATEYIQGVARYYNLSLDG